MWKFLKAVLLLISILLGALYFISAIYKPEYLYSYGGYVVEEDNHPISEAMVEINFFNAPTLRSQSNVDGSFLIRSKHGAALKALPHKPGYMFFCLEGSDIFRRNLSFMGWSAENETLYYSSRVPDVVLVEGNNKLIIGETDINFLFSSESDSLNITFESSDAEFFLSKQALFLYPKDAVHNTVLNLNNSSGFNRNVFLYFTKNMGGKNSYGWVNFTFKPKMHKGPTLIIHEHGVNTGSDSLRRERPCLY